MRGRCVRCSTPEPPQPWRLGWTELQRGPHRGEYVCPPCEAGPIVAYAAFDPSGKMIVPTFNVDEKSARIQMRAIQSKRWRLTLRRLTIEAGEVVRS